MIKKTDRMGRNQQRRRGTVESMDAIDLTKVVEKALS